MDLAGKVDLVIGARQGQTQITRLPDAQLTASCVVLLRGLAEARQATVADTTYKLFARHLAEFEVGDVKEAVKQLACTAKGEYEQPFPSLGQIIDRVFAVRKARVREMAMQKMRECDEANFWDWVDEQIYYFGKSEQEILDAVRTPGYTGRKARVA